MLQEQATLNTCTCISYIICFVGLHWSHNVTSWQHSETTGSTTKIRVKWFIPFLSAPGTTDLRTSKLFQSREMHWKLTYSISELSYKGLPLEKLRIRNWILTALRPFHLHSRDPDSPRDALSRALIRRSTARRRTSWGAGCGAGWTRLFWE